MITVPREVQEFLDNFKQAGYELYIVGGAVRDLLLTHTTNNWDFATNATPEEILKLYPNGFYNNQFGTVGIEIEVGAKKTIFEVTTYRKESNYTDNRRPDNVQWAKTVAEDLARRDFTINAMAFDGEKIIDLFSGQQHLAEKKVVAVGEPSIRFNEDALRLMRAVRIATVLNFTIEPKTLSSIRDSAQLITSISMERIRDELFRILASEHAADGILLLRDTGLLKHVLPEVEECFAVEQKSPKRHHMYDVGTHLVMSLKYCPSADIITKLATLLHDIGKSKTYRKDPETQIITFYNHEVAGTTMVEKIADRLRLSRKQKDKLVTLVKNHQFTVSEKQTDKALRRFIRAVTKEYLSDILDLRLADRLGSGAKPTSWRFDLYKKRLEEVQQEPFKVTDLKINGQDVMKILKLKPGPEVGKTLQLLFDQVVEGKVKNAPDDLIKALPSLEK